MSAAEAATGQEAGAIRRPVVVATAYREENGSDSRPDASMKLALSEAAIPRPCAGIKLGWQTE